MIEDRKKKDNSPALPRPDIDKNAPSLGGGRASHDILLDEKAPLGERFLRLFKQLVSESPAEIATLAQRQVMIKSIVSALLKMSPEGVSQPGGSERFISDVFGFSVDSQSYVAPDVFYLHSSDLQEGAIRWAVQLAFKSGLAGEEGVRILYAERFDQNVKTNFLQLRIFRIDNSPYPTVELWYGIGNKFTTTLRFLIKNDGTLELYYRK